MTKHSKQSPRARALNSWQDAQKFPEHLLRRYLEEALRDKSAKFREKIALQKEAAKYRSVLQNAAAKGPGANADAKRALAGLRKITGRLAKRKIVAPALIPQPPGINAGSYTQIFTPPYKWAFTESGVSFGNPHKSVSALKSTGQFNCVVNCDAKVPGAAFVEGDIGIYFLPTFTKGSVTVSVNPSAEYSWWVNTISNDYVGASQGYIHLYYTAYDLATYNPPSLRFSQRDAPPSEKIIWSSALQGGIDFGFGSSPGYPLQISFPVSGNYYYAIGVSCTVQADAEGWPGSLAAANLAVTLPSFTLYVQPLPVTR